MANAQEQQQAEIQRRGKNGKNKEIPFNNFFFAL